MNTARSVVDVLMSSQSSPKLPSKLSKENMTKKDVLFNDVIDYTCKRGDWLRVLLKQMLLAKN